MGVVSSIIIGLLLSMFTVCGIAGCVFSARHFVAAVRSGVIRQEGQELSFNESPWRFRGALVHMAFGFMAGLSCLMLVVILLARTQW